MWGREGRFGEKILVVYAGKLRPQGLRLLQDRHSLPVIPPVSCEDKLHCLLFKTPRR